jgi:DNA-binding LacI/PurR family transcriptional regulator
VVCGNDQIARGLAEAIREAGLRCPQDIALTGFDNWNVMVEACRPPLTSVDMNLAALGAEAGRHLAAMIKGARTTGTHRSSEPSAKGGRGRPRVVGSDSERVRSELPMSRGRLGDELL